MQIKYFIPALIASAIALVACTSEEKAPEQNQQQVSSPGITDTEPGVDEMVDVDEFPVPSKRVDPTYPEPDRKKGVEGTIWVKVLVNKEGRVVKTVVTKRTDGSETLEQAAVDAVRQWTFKPATVKQQPVSVWVAIPFKFKLGDK
jgi:protein TonB